MQCDTKGHVRRFNAVYSQHKRLLKEATEARRRHELDANALYDLQKETVRAFIDNTKALQANGAQHLKLIDRIERDKKALKQKRERPTSPAPAHDDYEPHEYDPDKINAARAKSQKVANGLDTHYDALLKSVKEKHSAATVEREALQREHGKKSVDDARKECQSVIKTVRDNKHKRYAVWEECVKDATRHNAERERDMFKLKYELLYNEAVKRMPDDKKSALRNRLADEYDKLKGRVVRKELPFPALNDAPEVKNYDTDDESDGAGSNQHR